MTGSALNKIELRGFKSIREMNLSLTQINTLIGANGAGKTNFISFFRLLGAVVDRRLQDFVARSGGANSLLYNGRKQTEQIYVKLEFGENLYEATLGVDNSDALYFVDETAYVWDRQRYDRPYEVGLGGGHRETRLFDTDNRVTRYVRDKIKSWRLYHFHDTSASAAVKQTGDIGNNAALSSDAGNLAAYLLLLRERYTANYRQIVDAVQLAAPFFDDFVLRPSPFDESKIRLEWRQKGADAVFGPNDFSDGTLRFICLTTALLQPQPPATMLIDEPELGLHPYAITLLTGLIRSASRRMQVVVSTQSVPLVNQFAPDEVVVVDRYETQSTFHRLESDSMSLWLEDYGLGDLWEKNVIGGRPTHA
jgi:predicted ATPase